MFVSKNRMPFVSLFCLHILFYKQHTFNSAKIFSASVSERWSLPYAVCWTYFRIFQHRHSQDSYQPQCIPCVCFKFQKGIEENKYIPNNNLYHDFPLYDHHHHFVSFSAFRSPCLVDNNTHTQQTIPKFHNVKILSINIFYNRN